MRRRITILLGALLLAGIALIARPAQPTYALQAWLEKAKSDCNSLSASITLVYNNDDTGDAEFRDYFRLEIYDEANNLLAQVDESITKDQSPFYWQTGRIPAAAYNGKYKIEVHDMTDTGAKVRRIEQVWHDCTTDATWREKKPTDPNPELPAITCWAWVPVWTTNYAPESGAVVIVWSYYDAREKDNDYYEEYHLGTIRVLYGQGMDEVPVRAPCGTYLHLYYQPDSTKLLYNMPSQYWPYEAYGVPKHYDEVGPIYYTFFPLDGPERGTIPTLTPTNTTTPETPWPTKTPTKTPKPPKP